MSDPVKTNEVEDVLFSIRRLVSDSPDSVKVPETSGKAEALFLSSSLRVSDPATEPEQIELEDMTTGLSHFRDAVAEYVPETAPDAESEMAGENVPDPAAGAAFSRQPEDTPKRRLTLSEVFDDLEGISDPVAGGAGVDDGSLHADELSVDDVLASVGPDEALERMGVDSTPEQSMDWFKDTEEVEPVEDSLDAEPASDVVPDPVVETTAQAESDVVEEDAGVVMPQTDEPASDVDLGDLDASLLDEDALRDMISEIVRDELSGVLGERITRNVRKLVRREIHRALMSREFD